MTIGTCATSSFVWAIQINVGSVSTDGWGPTYGGQPHDKDQFRYV